MNYDISVLLSLCTIYLYWADLSVVLSHWLAGMVTWLIFLSISIVWGRDGCLGGYWRCGDTCIALNGRCYCGDSFCRATEAMWCCNTGPCSKHMVGGEENGYCNGTVQPLTTSCEGSCNFYPHDEFRNYARWNQYEQPRSHIPCKNYSCRIKGLKVYFF